LLAINFLHFPIYCVITHHFEGLCDQKVSFSALHLAEDVSSKKHWCKPLWVLFGVAVFLVVYEKRMIMRIFLLFFMGDATPFFDHF